MFQFSAKSKSVSDNCNVHMVAIVFSDPFWLQRLTSGTVFPDPDPNFRVDPVFFPKSLIVLLMFIGS